MKQYKINYKVIYAFDDKKYIYLMHRIDGKKVIETIDDFEWYFCISLSDYGRIGKDIFKKYNVSGVVKKIFVMEPYLKIYCARDHFLFNQFITDLKNLNVSCLEMDLSLTKRFMIDNHIELEENLKIGFFDIETDDTIGNIEIGRDQILSWAIVDDTGKKYYYSSSDEKELLTKFFNMMDKYDVIVGWNSSGFDIPYIQKRSELHRLQWLKKDGVPIWKRTMQVDLMMRYVKLFAPIMSILNLSGFSLNEMSKVFLKREKTDIHEKINVLFEKDPEKLKEYNINDCLLVMELNKSMNTLPLMIKECVWTGSFLDKFYVGELLDNYILRESKKAGKYLLSRPNKEEETSNRAFRITGGYVKEPLTGFYDNVRVFDFKSLYPTIMIGYNLGDDSLVKELCKEGRAHFDKWLNNREIEKVDFDEWLNFLLKEKELLDPKDEFFQSSINQYFRKEPASIVSDLLKNLLQQRREWKKLMDSYKEGTVEFANARASQEVIKELANSMFGITADASSRYYNPFFSESITYTGQFWNRLSSKLLSENLDLMTLYADTDSVFLQIMDDEKAEEVHGKMNELLNEAVKKIFHLHPDKDLIDLEYEKKYKKLILLDKKRYIGQLIWSNGKDVDFIHSRGTENIKKDTINFTKKKLVELVKLLINGMTLPDAVKWIENLQLEVKENKINKSDLVIVKKLSKPIDEYKSKSTHVRLAEKLIKNKMILDTVKKRKVSTGERIFFVVTDMEDKENGAMLYSDWDGKNWDKCYYWRVHIYAPLKRILQTVFKEYRWDRYNEIELRQMLI